MHVSATDVLYTKQKYTSGSATFYVDFSVAHPDSVCGIPWCGMFYVVVKLYTHTVVLKVK